MSGSSAAARCYAEALLLLAKEKGNLERVVEELHVVAHVFHTERSIWGIFTSPRIDRQEKEAFIRKAIAGGRVGPEVSGLLVVLVRKGREAIFDNIVDEFIRFRDLEMRRIHMYLHAARVVDDAVRDALTKAVEEVSGKTVVLHERTDPSLISGLVVRVGDVVLDGSLRTRLRTLGTRLAADRT